MALSISRKVVLRCLAFRNSCFNVCPYSVRRNASSSKHEPSPLSSDASTIFSLGSSKQEAVRRVNPATATAVTALLRQHGFTAAHISRLESRFPTIFELNPEKNLSLKLKFLESIGISSADIPKVVLRNPYLLSASLEKKLIPCYNYLKNLSTCGDQLNQMLKSRPDILTVNVEATIAPNVELLRDKGVPFSIITYCLTDNNLAICCSHPLFKSSVDQAVELGLNPSTKAFILAVRVLCGNSKQKWAQKMEVYRGFGFSDDEILLAFRRQPNIMSISEENIARGLELFLKELSWTLATITSNPAVLQYSLENRVIPRTEVAKTLRKKGLLDAVKPKFLMISEEKFLKEYVHSYKDVSSELMDIYKTYTSSQKKTS